MRPHKGKPVVSRQTFLLLTKEMGGKKTNHPLSLMQFSLTQNLLHEKHCQDQSVV